MLFILILIMSAGKCDAEYVTTVAWRLTVGNVLTVSKVKSV